MQKYCDAFSKSSSILDAKLSLDLAKKWTCEIMLSSFVAHSYVILLKMSILMHTYTSMYNSHVCNGQ